MAYAADDTYVRYELLCPDVEFDAFAKKIQKLVLSQFQTAAEESEDEAEAERIFD